MEAALFYKLRQSQRHADIISLIKIAAWFYSASTIMLVVIITVPTADNFPQINSIEIEYTENAIFSKSLPRKMYIQVFP